MSGTQVSSFTNPNILLQTLSGQQTAGVTNQLLANDLAQKLEPYRVQQAQQQVSEADIEMMARASQGLLSLPDEASRAAAYPGEVSRLQSLGFATNAPPQYPGEAALRRVANMGVSLKDQYQLGLVTPPGLADALKGITAPLPGQPGYSGGSSGAAPGVAIPARGAGGPGATAQLPPAYLQHFRDAAAETGLPMDLLIAQARQESSFNPNAKGGAGEIGLFQIKPSTAQSPGFGLTGVDPATLTGPDNVRNNILFGARYLRARMGGGDPNDPRVQAAGLAGYNGGGDPNYVANVFRYRPGLAPSDPQRQIATYTPNAPAAPGAPPSTTQADLTGPRPLPQIGPATPVVTPESLANTPAPYQVAGAVQPPPAGATGAPAAPSMPVPQPIPPAQPPGTPQPTAPAALPPSGAQSQQYQRAMAIQRQIDALAPYANLPAAKAKIAQLQAEQQLAIQADSVVTLTDGRQFHPLTGKIDDAAAPLAQYEWDPQRGAYVDKTGVKPPVTPPSPRMTMTPAGTVIQSQPGGGATVVYQTPPTGVAEQAAAKAQGTATGDAYTKDNAARQARVDALQTTQATQMRYNEMANIVGDLNTGPTAVLRGRAAAYLQELGASKETLARFTGIPDAALAQEFTKMALATTGQSAKQDLGSNTGIDAVRIYESANPNLGLLPDANRKIVNMGRVQTQMILDYNLGWLHHFNTQQAELLKPGGSYQHPTSEFDERWLARNNPQVGAAAMGILNGDGYDRWARSSDDAQRAAAVAMVARIDPRAMIPMRDGSMVPVVDVLARLPPQ